jgi:hypothetical protein
MVLRSAQGMDVARIAKVALIRRYIASRNRHADNQARELVKRVNVA